MSHRIFLWALVTLAVGRGDGSGADLKPAPSPADNPLKGLVPFSGVGKDAFPHSMEFDYLQRTQSSSGLQN